MFDLTDNLLFSVHGGADSGGGVAGTVAGLLSFVEGLLALSPAEVFARLMPGVSALENLHPMFVHFPIALLPLFFLLDVIGTLANKPDWQRVAGWFLYIGALFAGFTVAAGLIAAGEVAHGGDVHEIMENHEHLGISVFALATILAVWRWAAKGRVSGPANTLYLICAAILAVLLLLTADFGGLMVYKYGVAVEPVSEMNKEAAARHQHGEGVSGLDAPRISEDDDEQPEHRHDHHDHSH
ncbi:MAG: DUF2231 domain-containing protein [Methylomonas sp.]|jgi:uncharacterized membrane protein|uniref:DUF2231 domain-containing protein n=1 Tax=Methylomonas sp. TaxID=418 RepID=UPI0025CF0DB5|nr:DUF2231 domain-containing protein [Methylomonas sp.]MCK9608105.1 DUF2231 domain-containing protein [Methylomonas sp.]